MFPRFHQLFLRVKKNNDWVFTVVENRLVLFGKLTHCFDNGYAGKQSVGKQPVAWKEYCAEY